MSDNENELNLYDETRQELRRRLSGYFEADFDLEATITASAYWVCTAVRNRGMGWSAAVQEYADQALSDARQESQVEQVELDLLRQELCQAASPLLDVGAGWGRFGPLYVQLGLEAVYAEPSSLGCQLLRRNGLTATARCLGQGLGFPARAFRSVVIGWVLHHDAPDVPGAAILSEIARVTADGGRLISIEPLRADFDERKWRTLVEAASFEVQKMVTFFESPPAAAEREQYACLVAERQASR